MIRTFVLHVSIARPLGEGGKLQLTSDMTELEFALSAFMAENSQSKRSSDLETIGDDYRALRALRLMLRCDCQVSRLTTELDLYYSLKILSWLCLTRL